MAAFYYGTDNYTDKFFYKKFKKGTYKIYKSSNYQKYMDCEEKYD
jgi:hypothetical protein